MAIISKKVCDRCGKEMVYDGWTGILKNITKKGKKIHIRKIFNGNPDGYSYSDSQIDLCRECAKKLEDFLRGEQI